MQAHEFSHTIIHGKPKAGQLVVGAAGLAPGGFAGFPTPPAPATAAAKAGYGPGASPAGAAGSAARRPVSGAQWLWALVGVLEVVHGREGVRF